MAGPKINVNRYRLITLLYVVFVCLSVLNIPVSLLDSNIHLIKTLEYQEKNRLAEVKFADEVISSQDISLFGDTARVYFDIQKAIHECYLKIDSVDKMIQKKFAADNTSFDKEFNSKRKMESYLLKDSLLTIMRQGLFNLVEYLGKQKFQLDTAIKSLVPVLPTVINHSGKELEWDSYLFLHKPTAISYMQIKRIKVLLLDNEYLYQNAALRTINLVPSFYSTKDKQVYAMPQDKEGSFKIIENTPLDSSIVLDSLIKKKNDSIKKIRQEFKDSLNKYQQRNTAQINNENRNQGKYDDIAQKIIKSFRTENYYLGIPNVFLKNFTYEIGKDIEIQIIPSADLTKSGDREHKIVFTNQGKHSVKFFDLRNGSRDEIIEMSIEVNLLPPPQVRLFGDNNLRDLISVKDLFIANRLNGLVQIPDLKFFPGRISGFRVTKISSQKEQQSIYNYGEVFQNQLHGLIKTLEKGDLVMFDRITVSMQDGTTRTTNSIVFKIDE